MRCTQYGLPHFSLFVDAPVDHSLLLRYAAFSLVLYYGLRVALTCGIICCRAFCVVHARAPVALHVLYTLYGCINGICPLLLYAGDIYFTCRAGVRWCC